MKRREWMLLIMIISLVAAGCGKGQVLSSEEEQSALSKPISVTATATFGDSVVTTTTIDGVGDPVVTDRDNLDGDNVKGETLFDEDVDPVVLTSHSGASEFLTGSRYISVVSVLVTLDGQALAGMEVALSRSISGRPLEFAWSGLTGLDGEAVIDVNVDSRRYWRSGASGYYVARVTDPVTGAEIGRRGSIAIQGGELSELRMEVDRRLSGLTDQAIRSIEAVRLDESHNGTQVNLYGGQVVIIQLESNPSTGYSWQVVRSGDAVVAQIGLSEFVYEAEMVGAPGKEMFQFTPSSEGEGTLELVYKHARDDDAAPLQTFRVQIVSQGSGDGQVSDPLILVPGPIGDDEPVSTKEPDIRGTITAIRDGGDGGTIAFLIEAPVGASTTFDKAWVSLARETRLLETSGDDFVAVSPSALVIGEFVEATFDGPVMESYPVQARAREIVIVK
jgi:inhibitor of cysteine peptidase